MKLRLTQLFALLSLAFLFAAAPAASNTGAILSYGKAFATTHDAPLLSLSSADEAGGKGKGKGKGNEAGKGKGKGKG